MGKSTYLAQPEVLSFVEWLKTQISGNSKLGHTYIKPGGVIVEFENLSDALENYDWPFHFTEPGPGGIRHSGSSYKEIRSYWRF